jgi:Fic family protein
MANIRKETRGKKTYYYLEHSVRERGSVVKKRLYLGEKIPKDIDSLKKRFLQDIYKERWFPFLESIKEAYSKEQNSMPPSMQEKEQGDFAVRFTYDTQRIEGSTLTLRETAELLEKGTTPSAKPIADVKEAEAHKELFLEMLTYERDLSQDIVLHWHRKLLGQTKPDIAGRIRQHQVRIAGSRFMPPSPVEVGPLLDDFFKWYGSAKKKLHPVELAALVHLRFVTIHPFADGNGRISRILMNFVLNRQGYPLFNIEYTGRSGYYTALERAQVTEEDRIFVRWLVRKYVKENRKRYGAKK